MHDIVTLSKLLHEVDSILRRADRLMDPRKGMIDPDDFTDFEQLYMQWYQACVESLPEDLGGQFVRWYEPGAAKKPTISDFFRKTNASIGQGTNTASPTRNVYWHYLEGFKDPLQKQRELLFSARRRLWIDTSILPKDMRVGIATICKTAYQIDTINTLFIRSGCEAHWYVPPFTPDPKYERMNRALGWFDGILVYAPSQELAITQTVCETMLAKPSISDEEREEIKGWLAQLQQPTPTLDNPLDRYDLHPTVRRVAGPLVAGNHLNQALLNVCIALNNAVQEKAAQPTLDGSGLMQRVFSSNNPILRCAYDSTEQQGWMYLFTGAIMAIRNPRAHRLLDDLTEAEAIEWLLFLSALFRALDAAEDTTTP